MHTMKGATSQRPNCIMDEKIAKKKGVLTSWPPAAPGAKTMRIRVRSVSRLSGTPNSVPNLLEVIPAKPGLA
ncbi:hypothetical protein ElyMa_003201900 [Elysia marginata]|uniref:Uncharacterized protein n=1 Tax=Elysia marginata TaxID=1093978 RepID=A0AAV4J0U5_9GAST|nr:hypothetical protein ElyMa_003201900 [Elysia marginata]